MSQRIEHEKINYIEFGVTDINVSKTFFNIVFGWEYVDYGEHYVAFRNAGIDGGFYFLENGLSPDATSMLVVFYSSNLEQTENKVVEAGGNVVKPVFSFPGGRRFHFSDPSGNVFAVWTDVE